MLCVCARALCVCVCVCVTQTTIFEQNTRLTPWAHLLCGTNTDKWVHRACLVSSGSAGTSCGSRHERLRWWSASATTVGKSRNRSVRRIGEAKKGSSAYFGCGSSLTWSAPQRADSWEVRESHCGVTLRMVAEVWTPPRITLETVAFVWKRSLSPGNSDFGGRRSVSRWKLILPSCNQHSYYRF